ncbi:MAG: hypothetical protein J0I77_04830 [Rudaea sp.]|uniref:hypothetical protein n=1 Tax=unclassified Rudaea TaxID=2627037 RepID=UPI001AD40AF7|nr:MULTISPECIES: hypothetical protein [unclassified Rudaea]MBN8885020.1 hypothetical protein [Rudaea sp.]
MKSALFLLLLLVSINIHAQTSGEQAACATAKGTYMTGTVVSDPTFAYGSYRQGVELSHTHIQVQSDSDGYDYDIAIDNVYADGYDQAGDSVPDPLTTLVSGTRVELCGLPFPGGMHWVHSNCGARPTPSDPNGWVKVLDSLGNAGPNLEENQEYCYLWN